MMSLLKIGLLGGAGCGITITPIATILAGKEVWASRGVFIIARSDDNSVLLYVQEKELPSSTPDKKETKLELTAEYNWSPIRKALMLCSPLANKDQYFLFGSTDTTFNSDWKTMNGDEKLCDQLWNNNDLGKPLSVNFSKERMASPPPKTIYLKNCEIKDLRKIQNSVLEKGNPSIELTCHEDPWKRDHKQIKLFDQGFAYI